MIMLLIECCNTVDNRVIKLHDLSHLIIEKVLSFYT